MNGIDVITRLKMVIDAVKNGYIPDYHISNRAQDVWMMIDRDEIALHHGDYRFAITMNNIEIIDNECDGIIIGNPKHGRLVIPYKIMELLV